MKSQTSLAASQVLMQQWAEQIRNCQNRPEDMDVATWCDQNGIGQAGADGPGRSRILCQVHS